MKLYDEAYTAIVSGSEDNWTADLIIFGYGSYQFDIANLRAYGSSFCQAVENLVQSLRQLGFRGYVVVEGPQGELYGEIDFAPDKPKMRLFWQVDWSGLLAGEYDY